MNPDTVKAMRRPRWFLWLSLIAIAGAAHAQTATPVTPSAIPPGVPTPPAIPPIPALSHPVTIQPGAVFEGDIIHGDGITDDTAGVQAALKASDVIVASATYAIAGNVTIPTGRHIFCNAGATFLDTQAKSTRMFQIGYSSLSLGNNSIVGCHLQGTDFVPGQPASYANYKGGTNGYSELLEITSGWGLHADNVLIQNSTFSNAQGDSILTYSPCGTANTGAACNHGSPGTEGPSNIFIVSNTFTHCGQPAVHLNGGQNLVVTGNTFTDCPADDEADANVLQVMTSWWFGNMFATQYGTLNALNGKITGPDHSCTGDDLIPQNDEGCWSFNNTFDGVSQAGPTVLREPTGCTGGGGHYLNEHLTHGAQLRTGC